MNELGEYGFVKRSSKSVGFVNIAETHGAEVQGLQTGVWAEIIKNSFHITDYDMLEIDTLLFQDRADIRSRASPVHWQYLAVIGGIQKIYNNEWWGQVPQV